MAKSKGANQYGKYIWLPSEDRRSEAKYSARLICKGFAVKANCDSKDELIDDLAELIRRIQPLVSESGVPDEKES